MRIDQKVEDYESEPARQPYWLCQECGARDSVKPMPSNREAFYNAVKAGKCKRCKSEAMSPVGY